MKISLAIHPAFYIIVVAEIILLLSSTPKVNYFNATQLALFCSAWVFFHLAVLLSSITITKE